MNPLTTQRICVNSWPTLPGRHCTQRYKINMTAGQVAGRRKISG